MQEIQGTSNHILVTFSNNCRGVDLAPSFYQSMPSEARPGVKHFHCCLKQCSNVVFVIQVVAILSRISAKVQFALRMRTPEQKTWTRALAVGQMISKLLVECPHFG